MPGDRDCSSKRRLAKRCRLERLQSLNPITKGDAGGSPAWASGQSPAKRLRICTPASYFVLSKPMISTDIGRNDKGNDYGHNNDSVRRRHRRDVRELLRRIPKWPTVPADPPNKSEFSYLKMTATAN